MNMKFFGACAAVAALVAVPALSHPHPEGEKTEKVIILEGVGGDLAKGKEGETRSIRIHRKDGESSVSLSDCDENNKTEISEGTGKERTHIVLCGKGNLTAEERAKKLEELRSRLGQNDRLSTEHRARVEAALQRAIERLRAGN